VIASTGDDAVALSGELEEILDAYRVPLAIAAFGVLISFIGFFLAISRSAEETELAFAAEVNELSSIVASRIDLITVELEQIANGLEADVSVPVLASVFTRGRFDDRSVGFDLLFFETGQELVVLAGNPSAAASFAARGEVETGFAVSVGEAPPSIVFERHTVRGRVVAQAELATLVPPDFEGLTVRLLGSTPATEAGLRSLRVGPMSQTWTAPAPMSDLRMEFVSTQSGVFNVGAAPWFVLAVGLLSTITLFFIAYAEARKTLDVRLEVARKTEELRASHAIIASKNQELERFAAHASHDLQAPLRGMKGWSDALRRRDVELDETSRAYLDRISASADRAQSLVQSLLDYTAAEHRQLELQPIDLDRLAEDVGEMLAEPIRVHGGQVSWNWHAPLVGDVFLVTRLVLNLVGNALKYCEESPVVEVSTRTRDDMTVLSVRDNGIGIAPQHSRRIFEAFDRLHGQAEYEGHGLGLAMCRRIAALHGASIELESELGEGSEFRVVFPPPR